MSSNGNGNERRPSRKELEILQRQRAVARQRQQPPPPNKPPPPPPPSTKRSNSRSKSTSLSQLLGQKPPKPKPSISKPAVKPSRIPIKAKVIDLTDSPPHKSQLRPSVKRPTMKRPTKKTLNSTDSHAVNAAILAARSRLKQQHSSATQAAHRSPEDFLEKKPAAAIASASARGGRLSHLLNRVGVTNCELKNTQGKSRTSWEEEEDRNGTALDMDDY